jgi:LPXTG-motif cell wall-anchored protein
VVGALATVPALIASPAYAAAGDFTSYSASGAWVWNVGLGPGGNPWYTNQNAAGTGGNIGYVDVTTGIAHDYLTPLYYSMTGITEGPDGNMWFIALGNTPGHTGTFLDQFDVTTHVVTQYLVPTAGGIDNVVSAAGKLWITEGVGNAIASFDPSTTDWNEYTTPAADPDGLTLAPDGILWYAMYNAQKVGSIDPNNPSTSAAIATGQPANQGSNSLTTTPDGKIWVAEINDQRIDSYDPSTSSWTTGSSLGLDVFNVTTGPDGNVWYSTYAANGVGKLDVTTGTHTNYTDSAGGTQWMTGIVAASDGNIWTGAYLGKNLVRFELPHAATITTASLPGGKVNLSYSQTLAATGTGPITFAVTAGALPAGLVLDPATGVISGTPTTIETASFTITATGADGASDTAFTIAIGASLAATGTDITVPTILAGLLLLVGAGLLLLRRRRLLPQS